ncbi:efflux RND transporter periplasmic adaptor subunit [Breznakiella homolactica]|uniref:Efflux RND transporter periplasmic adaptor subunit n=1 Tax=Breznakiella homolactica TaxID=2798577 RepID=A0A7T7XQM0_9SPIR|nr:efflux RND transporter periplasmic adaptor subunit [Breznakiella homolactica]QQO10694.1 efflux RND transporter periplasmic adaptor subunit [Breznakiella homolactica]
MKIKSVLGPILASFAAALIFSACAGTNGGGKSYEFTTVTVGSLEKTVSASGTLQPVSTVNVLAQMSGKVEHIYVDYNDTIGKGDILAELNTDMLRLQREQQLASVVKARANYELQQLNYGNQEKLAEKNLISEYELKTGKTTLDIQAAELSAAEAALKVIETEINQYAFITSPIDGIVLERNISTGQNVVEGSSSNSSSLFTLAESLQEMQIEASVDELDIAAIRNGQEVRFTLEALPGKNYSGSVETVYLMPTTSDNVVSYTVIIAVSNRDGALLPGMTCEVEFIQERRENILMVPNAALRYQPASTAAVAEKNTSSSGQSGLTALVMPSGPPMGRGGPPPGGRNNQENSTAQTAPVTQKTIWFLNDAGKPESAEVFVGISDGSFTEIIGSPELSGKEIILRERV